MKRYAVFLGLILVVAVAAWAHDSVLRIRPSDMKDGETRVLQDDGRTITLEKKGDLMIVKIDGAGDTKTLTITRDGDELRVLGDGDRDIRTFVIGPERRRLVLDGMHSFRNLADTWYVCPKDKTIVRIPESKAADDATYKCPLDGTTLEKRKGHGFMFMFDDENIIGL